MFGRDLPKPAAGRLTLYVLGPGFGESVVAIFPDGGVLVMDACQTAGGEVLPNALLRHLGIQRIDLLVLSHPDLDHVRGVAELIRDFDPRDVWCYPLSSSIRGDLIAYGKKHARPKYRELAKALAALDAHLDRTGRVAEPSYGYRDLVRSGVVVRCLAPTDFDRARARRTWTRLITRKGGPAAFFNAVLSNHAKLGDAPNVLSLALSISYECHQILLGGDVMRGSGSRFSGWKGILGLLRDDGLDACVRDLSVVKVAHHGSRHSFEPSLWDIHAAKFRPVAVVAPFTPAALPHGDVLAELRARADALLVTSAGAGEGPRATAAGWEVVTGHTLTETTAPVVAVELLADGTIETHSGAGALTLMVPS